MNRLKDRSPVFLNTTEYTKSLGWQVKTGQLFLFPKPVYLSITSVTKPSFEKLQITSGWDCMYNNPSDLRTGMYGPGS